MAQVRKSLPCQDGDQSLQTSLLRHRLRCMSRSFNCYEPTYLVSRAPNRTVGKMDDCLLDRNATRPHIVHFATLTKPWLESQRPLLNRSAFYMQWAVHRDAALAAVHAPAVSPPRVTRDTGSPAVSRLHPAGGRHGGHGARRRGT